VLLPENLQVQRLLFFSASNGFDEQMPLSVTE
jgi:hypothetical protein